MNARPHIATGRYKSGNTVAFWLFLSIPASGCLLFFFSLVLWGTATGRVQCTYFLADSLCNTIEKLEFLTQK
jgi:hypothetical protein